MTTVKTTPEELQKCLERLNVSDPEQFVLALSPKEITREGEKKQEPPKDSSRGLKFTTTQDKKVATLLQLVSQYEKLANGLYRSYFIDGFNDLSRAEFNSTRTFRPDSCDMRPCEACKILEVGNGSFQLRNRLELQNSAKLLRTKEENQDKVGSRKGPKGNNDNVPEFCKKASSVDLNLFNRQDSAHSTSSIKSESEKSISETNVLLYRDPISQFGGIVPYQLRQAQEHFLDALADAVALVALQKTINTLITEIE